MRNPVLRDQDELEGALLPIATPVLDSTAQGSTAPLAAQVLKADNTGTSASHPQVSQPPVAAAGIPRDTISSEVSYLPPYPEQTEAYRRDEEARRLRIAQSVGRMQAFQEIYAVQKHNQQALKKTFHEEVQIQLGNDVGRCENALEHMGIQRPAPSMPLTPSAPAEENSKEEGYQFQSTASSGYEVNEYNFNENYETKGYECAEYKSIYD